MPSNICLHSGEGESAQVDPIEWGDYSIQYFYSSNPDSSSANEDALFLSLTEDILLFGVADGAGGHPKGEEASKTAAESLISMVELEGKDFAPAIAIERANEAIQSLKVGAKCTLAFVSLCENRFRSGAVGDSEIVYWNSVWGELYTSVPHSSVGYQVEAGLMGQADSLDAQDRNYVDNLMGDAHIRMELSSGGDLKKGHRILLGSDGLFDNFSHDELAQILREDGFADLSEKCRDQNSKTWKKKDDIALLYLTKKS
jgi:serine/threonine protein phosphatase PrpC